MMGCEIDRIFVPINKRMKELKRCSKAVDRILHFDAYCTVELQESIGQKWSYEFSYGYLLSF